ncbi:MAG: cell wall hydrolase [Patescibacteria group bacterium]|jgi:hypothetical protein
MKLITEDKLNKIITKQYSWDFNLEENGLYLIEIIASAKSWWQNAKRGRTFFKDDDIFLFLDERELTTSKNTKQDARSAWNGNELKGLEKTLLMAVNLKKGRHVIALKPNQSPSLKSLSISKIKEKDKIEYVPVNNNPAQKSEGRPWLSYIILDLLITRLSISARAPRSKKDDDDIKLLINGVIQRNENPKAHRDWYWCGQVLKGEDKIFSLSNPNNSNSKQFNIDLYSDGAPRLNRIELEFKRIPTIDNPEWTEDFNDDTDEMILARLIFGEAEGEPREAKIWVAGSVINRVNAQAWPDTIKGVILQKGQYDPFKTSSDIYKKIISPLGFDGVGVADQKSWYECYEIAQDIISKKINNPTSATHFLGKGGMDIETFKKTIVPKGKFLKKIGNTSFYWSPN